MGIFGSAGYSSKKTSGTQDTTSNKIEKLLQTGSENTNTTQSGSQTQSGSSTNQSTGATTQTDEQKKLESTRQQNQQTGAQTSLNQGFIDQIQNLIGGVAGNSLGGGSARTDLALDGLGRFDAEKFINDSVLGAGTPKIADARGLVNKLNSDVGGTGKTNTMSALLGSRVQTDLDASLAGIRSNATATASQIRQSEAKTIADAKQGETGSLAALINSIKGANVGTSQTGTSTGTSEGSTQGSSAGTASESSSQTSQQKSASESKLASLVSSLLDSLTNTNLVENQKSTGKSSGFDLKLGFGKGS